MLRVLSLFVALLIGAGLARAVENVTNSTYNETAPTASDIPNWTTGWTQPVVQPPGTTVTTGWNYVGSVSGASAIYMGNGWVMTCAHISAGNLTLNGQNYNLVASTVQAVGNTDIQLFQVAPDPGLPPLKIRATDPTAFSTKVALLGWGHTNGNRVSTWGWNTVTVINQSITPDKTTFVSNDFLTITGPFTSGGKSTNNSYEVVIGDSGGAAFDFNSTTQTWELAGMCETDGTIKDSKNNTFNFSGMVQLDTYATQINAITAPSPMMADGTPAMPTWMLVAFGGLLLFVAQRHVRV